MNFEKRKPIFRRLFPWLVPAALIAVWHLLAVTGRLPARTLPAPLTVLAAALRLVHSGELPRNLLVSAERAGAGFCIGGSIGLALGLLTGTFAAAESLLDNSLQMLRTVPNLALIPLVILWLGIGEEAKIFLIAVGVFFPIYLNTYHGIRTADAGLKEMGRVYGLNGAALFWQVVLPGAMPSILIGVRFALGAMWLTLIAAEALAAESGIGFMTTTAREFMQIDVVLVGTLLYALLGKGADAATKLLERRLLAWHPNYQKQG